MITATTNKVPGREIIEIIGVVRGNSVRAKFILKDLLAWFRSLAGGEINEYKELLNETREKALKIMVEDAKILGADAVVGIRFETTNISAGTSELLAYGTAVKLK